MEYSLGAKVIFIHVQKTGGISIETALRSAAPDAKRIGGRHITAVAGRDAIGPDAWAEAFSFAFVRNPWDRLLSWYEMIARETSWWDMLLRRKPANWRSVMKNSHDFESFVLNCTETIMDRATPKSFVADQTSYLADAQGELLVSAVGRFEALQTEYRRLFAKAGLPLVPLPHKNRRNSSSRDYRLFYSDRIAEIVGERFKRDIERFHYSF